MSNIAEGLERGGVVSFHHLFSTARASCVEVHSQLYVALDVGYLDQTSFDRSMIQAEEEVARVLGGLRAAVDKQRRAGEK